MPKVQKFSSELMLTFFLVKNLFMFSVRISSYGASGKFGEHEKCVRVARGEAVSNCGSIYFFVQISVTI